MLRDDPNESSAVYLLTSDNKHAVRGTDFTPMQINFFVEETFDHVPGKEKDQISLMFISEHQRKTNFVQILFFITQIIIFRNS